MNPSVELIVDRMATLAARIHDPDEKERRYASMMLDKLWQLYEAVRARR